MWLPCILPTTLCPPYFWIPWRSLCFLRLSGTDFFNGISLFRVSLCHWVSWAFSSWAFKTSNGPQAFYTGILPAPLWCINSAVVLLCRGSSPGLTDARHDFATEQHPLPLATHFQPPLTVIALQGLCFPAGCWDTALTSHPHLHPILLLSGKMQQTFFHPWDLWGVFWGMLRIGHRDLWYIELCSLPSTCPAILCFLIIFWFLNHNWLCSGLTVLRLCTQGSLLVDLGVIRDTEIKQLVLCKASAFPTKLLFQLHTLMVWSSYSTSLRTGIFFGIRRVI